MRGIPNGDFSPVGSEVYSSAARSGALEDLELVSEENRARHSAPADMSDPQIEVLLGLEHERCQAIVARDMAVLRRLVAENLVHTHTRGNTQNRTEYLQYIEREMVFQSVTRADLRVWRYGTTAVMSGKLTNIVRRKEDSDFVRVEAQALQVWVQSGAGWVQVAFQATALGPPRNVLDDAST